MLFAMVAHQNPQVRARAVQVIQRSRQQLDGSEVRKYQLVNVDFTATELTELLEHSTSPITQPSLTMDLSDPEIEGIRSKAPWAPISSGVSTRWQWNGR